MSAATDSPSRCIGRGTPTVVIEGGHLDARTAPDHSDVTEFMARAPVTRVCSYDRAGLGSSDPRPQERVTFSDITKELHTLLDKARISPPYIVAGHSFGGLLVRVFEQRYPQEVIGMIQLDAVSERDPSITLGGRWIREGKSRIDMAKSVAQVRAGGSLGGLPLVVITAGQSALDPAWMRLQKRLARISSDSIHVVARGASHGLTDERPELVAAAVRELVAAARNDTRLSRCGASLERRGGRCIR